MLVLSFTLDSTKLRTHNYMLVIFIIQIITTLKIFFVIAFLVSVCFSPSAMFNFMFVGLFCIHCTAFLSYVSRQT